MHASRSSSQLISESLTWTSAGRGKPLEAHPPLTMPTATDNCDFAQIKAGSAKAPKHTYPKSRETINAPLVVPVQYAYHRRECSENISVRPRPCTTNHA